MMSRNLYEVDNNPMYPRVDNGGKHNGIIASEFPVFNYMVYLVSIPFGYAHWYGRLINLILSTIASWYFYKLLKLYFDESIAFNATMLLTLSIWFGFSRKSMPDTFSMSLMILAFYQVFKFTKTNTWWRLALYGLLAATSILAKLPALFSLSILLLPCLSKNIAYLPKASIVLASICVFSIMYWWYFVWGGYLLKTWEYQLFFPKNYKEGPKEFLPYIDKAFEQFYFSAFQSFAGFGMFLLGLFYCFKNKIWLPLQILLVSFPVFVIFIVMSGNVFAIHSYYIIPFVPVMALIAGAGLRYLPAKIYPWILVLISLESLANQHNDFFIKDSEKFKMNLEAEINRHIPKGEKVAMAGTTGPQYLYFAHRRGWGLSPEQTLDTAYMNFVQTKGYRYLIVVKQELNSQPGYKLVGEERDIFIYDMSAK